MEEVGTRWIFDDTCFPRNLLPFDCIAVGHSSIDVCETPSCVNCYDSVYCDTVALRNYKVGQLVVIGGNFESDDPDVTIFKTSDFSDADSFDIRPGSFGIIMGPTSYELGYVRWPVLTPAGLGYCHHIYMDTV